MKKILLAALLTISAAFSVRAEEEKVVYGSVYNRPYSLSDNYIDTKMLGRNTLTLAGASLTILGFLYAMPSSFTNWEDDGKSPVSKWWDNVSRRPVIDEDDAFLNYVTHPYSGAVYYMGARSAGASAGYSLMYSFALSTFFWEYGVEAFAERPSIQDLIVTPLAGAILGEGFYIAKRHILENDYQLCGSRAFGKTMLYVMDPFTEISSLIWDDEEPIHNQKKNFAVHSYPTLLASGDFAYKVNFSYHF